MSTNRSHLPATPRNSNTIWSTSINQSMLSSSLLGHRPIYISSWNYSARHSGPAPLLPTVLNCVPFLPVFVVVSGADPSARPPRTRWQIPLWKLPFRRATKTKQLNLQIVRSVEYRNSCLVYPCETHISILCPPKCVLLSRAPTRSSKATDIHFVSFLLNVII